MVLHALRRSAMFEPLKSKLVRDDRRVHCLLWRLMGAWTHYDNMYGALFKSNKDVARAV
jgi:hypothetical protein